ncbi:alpha-tocopherol transfer protein-like [Brevipalpus obovatus]|uniref:alpha-tocopherol transfer protein-like n=1 Tax=Brevipalpus obovatus TaxID=246614 RepID=UPI003D9E60BA
MVAQDFTQDNNNNNSSDISDCALEKFRELIRSDPFLNRFVYDEILLRVFLRFGAGDMDKSIRRLSNYVNRSNKITYSNRVEQDKKVKKAFHSNILEITRNRETNHAVVIIRVRHWNPKEITTAESFQLIATLPIMLEQLLHCNGIQIIIDASGLSFRHIYSFGITPLINFARLLFSCLPMRIRQIHFIHTNSVANWALKMVEPFLDAKMRDRIIFYGNDLTTLHKHIPKDSLPSELGGTLIDRFTPDDYVNLYNEIDPVINNIYSKFTKIQDF